MRRMNIAYWRVTYYWSVMLRFMILWMQIMALWSDLGFVTCRDLMSLAGMPDADICAHTTMRVPSRIFYSVLCCWTYAHHWPWYLRTRCIDILWQIFQSKYQVICGTIRITLRAMQQRLSKAAGWQNVTRLALRHSREARRRKTPELARKHFEDPRKRGNSIDWQMVWRRLHQMDVRGRFSKGTRLTSIIEEAWLVQEPLIYSCPWEHPTPLRHSWLSGILQQLMETGVSILSPARDKQAGQSSKRVIEQSAKPWWFM